MGKNKTGVNQTCNELSLIAECEKKEKQNTQTVELRHRACSAPPHRPKLPLRERDSGKKEPALTPGRGDKGRNQNLRRLVPENSRERPWASRPICLLEAYFPLLACFTAGAFFFATAGAAAEGLAGVVPFIRAAIFAWAAAFV